MNVQNVWTTAAIAHAAFALASLTMCAAFARRVRLQGRAIVLLLMLLTLAAFFAAACGDAVIHTNAAAPRFTDWTLAAVILQILTGVLSLHFYSLSASQLLDAVGESKWLSRGPLLYGYVFLGIAIVRFYKTESSYQWLADGNAPAPPFFFTIFFISLGAIFRHLPASERNHDF